MNKALLMIGDSLIEYYDWAPGLPDYTVHNLGQAGERIEETIERLPRIYRAHPGAEAVVLMVGINNVAMGDTGIIEPYRELVRALRSIYPKARIYTTSLLPTLLPWIAEADLLRLNGMIAGLSEDAGARYMDVSALFKGHGVQRCLLEDGIHLSREGYGLWAEALGKELGGL